MADHPKPVAARVFDRLATIAGEGVDIHRCAAVIALGKLDYPGTNPVLQAALVDEDEDVRSDAVTALGQLSGTQSAGAILENLLGDPCPEVKKSAIHVLADMNHRDVVPWLLKLATHQDEEMNWDHGGYYDAGWEDWLDIQFAAITALGKMGVSEAVPEIVKAIENEDGQDVTQVAIPVLAQLGDDGVKALSVLFAREGEQMRRRICESLSPGRSPLMDDLITSCLFDESDAVRLIAIIKLIAHDPSDQRLPAYFADSDSHIRELLVEKLGTGHPAEVTERLGDKAPAVCQAAFRVIAEHPGLFEQDGFSDLVAKSIAGIPETAGEAAIAWAALIGEPSARSLGAALLDSEQPLPFRLGLIKALTKLDQAGFSYLAEAAGDSVRQVRINALTALADIAENSEWPNEAGQTLLAALKGNLVEPPEIEEETAETEEPGEDEASSTQEEQGAEAADTAAVSTLDQLMKSGVRTDAADPEDGAEPEEIDLSQEDERFIELSKLRAMKKKKISLDVKVAPHQDVRRFAARLMGDFDQPGVIKALRKTLKTDDDELKLSCLESLSLIGARRGRLKKKLFKAVNAVTRNGDTNTRMMAVRCLGLVKGKKSTNRIVELLVDPDVHIRREAVQALAHKSGHKKKLVQALQDDYSGVRFAAAKALAADQSEMDKLINLTLNHDGMHRADVVALLRNWNPNQAAERYLSVLEDEAVQRVWQVAIDALGDLLGRREDEAVQAAA